MRSKVIGILLGLLVAAAAKADTALTIPAQYGCLFDIGTVVSIPNPPTAAGAFNFNGVSGTGVLRSQVPSYWDESVYTYSHFFIYSYNYTIDLSAMASAPNHCVKLLIHFGTPYGCGNPGVAGSPSQIQSATLGPWGDVTLVFNTGCLAPGQSAISFGMASAAGSKTGMVTVIDDYTDPASGLTNETRINVPAVVPDVPPDPPPWEIAYYDSRTHPVLFQGNMDIVGTNQFNTNLPPAQANGNYDFTLQIVGGGTNGPVISPTTTQTVSVVNGLFQVPLPGDPSTFISGTPGWLVPAVRPAGSSSAFTPLGPPLPISPAPQALYAVSAGRVADLAPGQAVTSVNGLADAVTLQAGPGIALSTNGNTITISAPGTPSDRNIKTDFAPVSGEQVLSRLTALPISSWRYTNEVAGVRHVGPMAQDFKATFGLGNDDKIIGFVDEQGVALAAIQGLNEKLEGKSQKTARRLEDSESRIRQLETENLELKARLQRLEQLINARPGEPK